MTFTRPFVTRHFVSYQGEDSYQRALSIAFRAIDAFTDELPTVPIRVALKELPRARVRRNIGGFFCFEDIEAGNYTLLVEPDPVTSDHFYLEPLQGPWVDSFEIPITVVANVLLSFDLALTPKVSYPFPTNATLVRGLVTQGSPAGIKDAVVSTTYDQVDPNDVVQTVQETVETLTNRDGEYVLFFKRLPQVTQQITLTATKGVSQIQDQLIITEGKAVMANPLDLPP